MNVLVTAIGSMSADTVLTTLSEVQSLKLIGTDIYPQEWQPNAAFVSKFYQIHKATHAAYISQMLEICRENNINYIIPLTDPEVDCLSENAKLFEKEGVTLCISSPETILKCRDKSTIEELFKNSSTVKVVSSLSREKLEDEKVYPIIAKPKRGRSSEGLFLLKKKSSLAIIDSFDDYLFQPRIEGAVFTVDFIRTINGDTLCIPRKELIRTSNGAGITVEIIQSDYLNKVTRVIGETLNIIGCVNIEFISDGTDFYLIDINPRFSAGIGFSLEAGYDFVTNHLRCFQNKEIDKLSLVREGIISRISTIQTLKK